MRPESVLRSISRPWNSAGCSEGPQRKAEWLLKEFLQHEAEGRPQWECKHMMQGLSEGWNGTYEPGRTKT